MKQTQGKQKLTTPTSETAVTAILDLNKITIKIAGRDQKPVEVYREQDQSITIRTLVTGVAHNGQTITAQKIRVTDTGDLKNPLSYQTGIWKSLAAYVYGKLVKLTPAERIVAAEEMHAALSGNRGTSVANIDPDAELKALQAQYPNQ